MRTLSATLQAAQDASSGTPYIRVVFTSPDGLTTYDCSTDIGKMKQLEHHEEPYNDYATLVFGNSDRYFDDIDLTGYWVEIGYGFVTDVGNEYSSTPRLWVKSQLYYSAEGRLNTLIELEGMWEALAETLIRTGSTPYYLNEDYGAGAVIYAIIVAILAECSDDNYTFSLAALSNQDDGIINTFIPVFGVNTVNAFEDAAVLINRLIEMTACYIRPKAGLEFEVRYPQESDTPDVTFYSYQVPYFKEFANRGSLVIPNHIIVFANAGEDLLWTNIITAEYPAVGDQPTDEQITKYRDVVEIHTAETITTQEDADNRAAAIYARYKAEQESARMIVPHHCGLERFDYIEVMDAR